MLAKNPNTAFTEPQGKFTGVREATHCDDQQYLACGGEAMLVQAGSLGQVKQDIFSAAACTPNNQTRLIRAATPYLDIRRDLTFDPWPWRRVQSA